MPKLTFEKLSLANLKRCEEVFHQLHDWSPTDWACAMAGECGEACNQVKKLRRLDGADKPLDTPDSRNVLCNAIGYELADMVIYADLLAQRLGINLGYMVRRKFNDVSIRRGSEVRL